MTEETTEPEQTVFDQGPASRPGKNDILVIDDDDSVRGVLVKALRRKGYDVSECKDGKSGLAILAQNAFRLVITDIFMPDTDGYQVIMQIGQKKPKPAVLAMSGGALDRAGSALKTARLLGCSQILAKPFELAQVYSTVEQMIGPANPNPPPAARRSCRACGRW